MKRRASKKMTSPQKQKQGKQNIEGILLGMGNPLLDISAQVPQSFLDKYNVTLNNAILASEEHMPIYSELVKDYPVEYIAGGATQNTIRVAQWMIGKDIKATSYIGCVGNDENGKTLSKCASNDGVNVNYMIDDSTPTGTCAGNDENGKTLSKFLVNKKERSLIANVGAAGNYHIDHLLKKADKELKKARFIYCAGFFLLSSFDSIIHVGKHCLETEKTFLFNTSAPFIVQFNYEKFLEALEYASVLFGNESEFEALGIKLGLNEKDLGKIALHVNSLEKKIKKDRIIIITCGKDSTILVYRGEVTSVKVPLVSPETIVDTNGAGDAFVGGFMSHFVKFNDECDVSVLTKCIESGHYAASKIIQVSGVVMPLNPPEL